MIGQVSGLILSVYTNDKKMSPPIVLTVQHQYLNRLWETCTKFLCSSTM